MLTREMKLKLPNNSLMIGICFRIVFSLIVVLFAHENYANAKTFSAKQRPE